MSDVTSRVGTVTEHRARATGSNAERQARWREKSSLRRVELYLPAEVVERLDELVRERGASRRAAVVESLIAGTLPPVDDSRRGAPDPQRVPVKYIGQKPVKRDTVCGTGLEWTPGQVIGVPREMAERLLRHPDVWVIG